MLDALEKMPKVGYIRTPESLAYDLHYARRVPMPEGGEQLSLATKVNFDKNKKTISLENFGTSPVLLQSVRRGRSSR